MPFVTRVLIALCLGLALAGCETVKGVLETAPRPSARVIGANLQNLSLDKVNLVFAIEVSNPYPAPLPLTGLAYSLSSNGRAVLQGSVQPEGSIAAKGVQVIQVPAIVQFAALAKALNGVRPGAILPYEANLTLSVDAPALGAISLPLSESGEIPIPAVPQVELKSFDVASLTLDSVRANARLQMKNVNQFPLDLSHIGLNVGLGGKEVGRVSFSNSTKLTPGQVATIYVPLTFSPRNLGSGMISLLRGDKAGYTLAGSLEAGTPFGPLTLPFTSSGTTPISR
jgi:LEA14-like dessication related protein